MKACIRTHPKSPSQLLWSNPEVFTQSQNSHSHSVVTKVSWTMIDPLGPWLVQTFSQHLPAKSLLDDLPGCDRGKVGSFQGPSCLPFSPFLSDSTHTQQKALFFSCCFPASMTFKAQLGRMESPFRWQPQIISNIKRGFPKQGLVNCLEAWGSVF